MKVAVLGFNGPVVQETRGELTRRGHQCCAAGADAVIYLPGSLPELRQLVSIASTGARSQLSYARRTSP